MKTTHGTRKKVGSFCSVATCKGIFAVAFALMLMMFGSLSAKAQAYLCTVSGTVADATGAKVPGADINVTQVGTNYVTSGKTNEKGDYAIPFLNPGTYTVTVMASGFGTETQANIILTAGATKETDFVVKPGSTSDVMNVVAENTLLDTGSANNSMTLSAQEVTDLPNNGRNPYVMATLAPGIQNGGSGGYFQGTSSKYTNPFSGVAVQLVADGTSGHNRLTLNGQANDGAERGSGASYTGFVPSPEAVQEIQISSSVFDAQTGHGNGTVTNVVVKNGTNTVHGALYYVFQNTYLNANSRQNNVSGLPRNNVQLNQTGFVFSGPVFIPKIYDGRNKTFFTFAFERYQSHNAMPFQAQLPSAAQLKGDFSALCSQFDSTGFCVNGTQLYVPTSPTSTGPTTMNFRTQFFPYNNIASAINPTGAAMAKYYPDPSQANIPGAGPFDSNYNARENGYESKYPSYTIRFDQQIIPDKNRLNIVYFQAGLAQAFPSEGFDKGIATEGYGYNVYRRTKGGTLDDQHIFSASMVLDSRFGLNYHPFGLHYPGENYDIGKLGISGSYPVNSFPGAELGGNYPNLQSGAGGQVSTDTTGTLTEILTKVAGAHTVKVGNDWSIKRYNIHNPLDGFGAFGFYGTFTELDSVDGGGTLAAYPNQNTGGDSLADLLLGYASYGSYAINASYAQQQIYVAPYVQDTWRVSNRLTVTLGVRWDYESPLTERFNKVVNGFCFTCASPLQAQVTGLTVNGGLTYANANHRSAYPRYYKAVQPRVGFSYQLTPSTTLRGGYGEIYLNTLYNPIGTGYSQGTSFQGYQQQSSQPITSISNPFPNGVLLPTGSGAGLSTAIGQGPSFVDPNHVPPRSNEYSVSLQQQLPDKVVLQIAYVGKNPNHLEVSHNLDFLPANLWNQGPAGITYINTYLPNPLAGLIPQNSTLNAAQIYRYYLLQPYPQYSSLTELYSSIGSSDYNAMQLQVSHGMSHHVSFQGNFTWEKVMNKTGYLDNYALALGKLARVVGSGPSMYGNIFGTVELPKLQGAAAWERLSIGGWKFNSVIRMTNGSLLGTPSGFDVVGDVRPQHGGGIYDQYNTCYAVATINNATNSVSYTNRLTTYDNNGTVTRKACDSLTQQPAFRQRISYQSTTTSPVLNVRQFGLHPLVDMSLFKQFQIGEKASFEIRGEYFNVFNTGEFGGPGALGAANAGSSAGAPSQANPKGLFNQLNDPRIGQLTARFNF